MMKMIYELAKISNVFIGIEDHSIMTFEITVDYESYGSQVISGYALDKYDINKKRRVGTAYGCEIIRRIIEEFNISNFEELKGKHCWIFGEGEGFTFKPKGIKSLCVDNKHSSGINFNDIYNEFKSD